MGEHSTPDEINRDALVRAWRTFGQGLVVVAALAGATALYTAVTPGVSWTGAYWSATGLAIAQAVLSAVASYVHRKLGSDPSV